MNLPFIVADSGLVASISFWFFSAGYPMETKENGITFSGIFNSFFKPFIRSFRG